MVIAHSLLTQSVQIISDASSPRYRDCPIIIAVRVVTSRVLFVFTSVVLLREQLHVQNYCVTPQTITSLLDFSAYASYLSHHSNTTIDVRSHSHKNPSSI